MTRRAALWIWPVVALFGVLCGAVGAVEVLTSPSPGFRALKFMIAGAVLLGIGAWKTRTVRRGENQRR